MSEQPPPVWRSKKAPIEDWGRLSRSRLWPMQRAFFEREGMRAWSEGTVPHQVTSNPFIADAYARMILGFLRDCRSGGALPEKGAPLYIIELGAGSGRLGFRLLRRLRDLVAASSLGPVPIRYVMTDFSERTIAAWSAHPALAPLVEAGLLDFARFDVEHDDQLTMTATGERLRPHGMAAPLVVIANYVFDGLPQDAFQVENGILLERLVAVAAPAGAQDADVLDNIDLVWRLEPAATPCYQDADWNALLEQYRARLPKASFLFPVAALAGLDRLRRLTDGPLALLIADKGTDRDQDLLDHDVVPTLTRHGSVSMMVDCQLIGALARRRGGVALHPRHRSRALNVSALLFGETQDGWRETELAYRQAVDRFGPDDLVSIRDAVEGGYERMSVTEIIAFLRLCAWDHRRFLVAVPALRRQAQALPDRERRELLELVRAVWSDFLPIGEEDDLAFEIGVLLVDLGLQAEALEFFEASVELYGSTAATSYNMALCHWAGQRPAAARAAVDAALALAPEFAAASELRQRIEAAAQDAADTTRSWLR